MLTNKEMAKIFDSYARLLELHAKSAQKIRVYKSAVFSIEKTEAPLFGKSATELQSLPGIGKSLAQKMVEISETGTFADFDALMAETPSTLLEFFTVKGLGAKKVRTIWKELDITTLPDLLKACEEDKIAALKGLGKKTQESIHANILFKLSNVGRYLFTEAEPLAIQLHDFLSSQYPQTMITGQVRRQLEIIDQVSLVVGTDAPKALFEALDQCPFVQKDATKSSPFVWRGQFGYPPLSIEIITCAPETFGTHTYIFSASTQHLDYRTNKGGKSMMHLAMSQAATTEEEIFEAASLPYIPAPMREGICEYDLIEAKKLPPKLIEMEDLKGVLHNHSTYSDGAHTLEEMARSCMTLGYQYLGISDHSQTAAYANGLSEEAVIRQHQEIDALNEALAPFKILKGIESDILTDGSLDYADDIMRSFDFVVSSIHSGLNMNIKKATQRLINAIENPFTSILGHLTGRLLLRREGYPLDIKKIIDACASNQVCIEINANPYRLDMDWRWVHYALDKGVMIAINPDAHSKDAYGDMYYGIKVGQKGGLTAAQCLNARPLDDLLSWLQQRK